jgi:hypothetical protein
MMTRNKEGDERGKTTNRGAAPIVEDHWKKENY